MERLKDLNAAQREAVMVRSGPLLVLAGAGTGKTRVITHRLVELIRSGIPPERILSVTFTNKAAREMQQRAARLFGKRLRRKPCICTFHALCVRILRQEISALGYPATFVIYDRSDQESAARTALRDIRVGRTSLRPGDLLFRISRWKMAGLPPQRAGNYAENDLDLLAAAAYRRYQANLRACGAVDFDDLLLLTQQLFDEFPEVLARYQSRFDYVQIDEYQDTNSAQFALVEALVRPHRNLCVVGDDDQSIYGWRGADVEHILQFQRHFPGAQVVRLEHNYRSTGPILEIANRLVQHNRGRHPKTLIPCQAAANGRTGGARHSDVRCLEFSDELAEAEGIVREITQLISQKRVPPGDIAILFRTNEQPRAFESELRRHRLRYVLIGGQSFFDRKEIRDLLAYLKTIANPDDDVSLLRIINTPSRGIGTATVEKLLKRAVKQRRSVWQESSEAGSQGAIPPKAAEALARFRNLVDRYGRQLKRAPAQMQQTLAALIEEIGYDGEIEKQYKTPAQRQARQATVSQLLDALREYTQRAEHPSLENFLEESALLGREEEPDTEDQLSENGVKLITLHSAKGLEFPRVYLVGLEEGLLPHRRSLEATEGAIAEERRLLYVGITRAMDHLTLSRAVSRRKWGKRRPALPSRFLFEMSLRPRAEPPHLPCPSSPNREPRPAGNKDGRT